MKAKKKKKKLGTFSKILEDYEQGKLHSIEMKWTMEVYPYVSGINCNRVGVHVHRFKIKFVILTYTGI